MDMSAKNFSRSRSKDSERKFGEAPLLGRVSRTPGSAAKSRGKRRRSMKRKTKVNVAVVAWTLLVSFVVLMLMLVFLFGYFRNKAQEAADAAMHNETAILAAAFSDQKTLEVPSIAEVEALSIVRAALANEDTQALTHHFILGKDTNPEQALATLAGIAENEGEITAFRWLGEKFVNGMVIGEVVTQRQAEDKYSNRLAQLVIGKDGKWRIDLDSYLRKGFPDWPEILSGESPISVVRIIFAADTYYNGIYSDETEWQAYILISPDANETLYGYARRDSPQDKALRKILLADEKIHRAAVEISTNSNAGRRQFEISGVLADNWVIGETRFDESF